MFTRKLLISSLVLIAAFLVLFTTPAPTSGRQNAIAALDPVQGLIQWRSADSTEDTWTTVTRAQLVQEGDWIRTDNLGLAYLTFFEGIETEILPDTVVRVAGTVISAVPRSAFARCLAHQIGVWQWEE